MDKLLPCKNCRDGREPMMEKTDSFVTGEQTHQVICYSCSMAGPKCETMQQAGERWNAIGRTPIPSAFRFGGSGRWGRRYGSARKRHH